MGILTDKNTDLSKMLDIQVRGEGTWQTAYPAVYKNLIRSLADMVVSSMDVLEEQRDCDVMSEDGIVSGKYIGITKYSTHIALRRSFIGSGLESLLPEYLMWSPLETHDYNSDTCTFMFYAKPKFKQRASARILPASLFTLFGDDLEIQIDICLQL